MGAGGNRSHRFDLAVVVVALLLNGVAEEVYNR
jgi:hypothetical protein